MKRYGGSCLWMRKTARRYRTKAHSLFYPDVFIGHFAVQPGSLQPVLKRQLSGKLSGKSADRLPLIQNYFALCDANSPMPFAIGMGFCEEFNREGLHPCSTGISHPNAARC